MKIGSATGAIWRCEPTFYLGRWRPGWRAASNGTLIVTPSSSSAERITLCPSRARHCPAPRRMGLLRQAQGFGADFCQAAQPCPVLVASPIHRPSGYVSVRPSAQLLGEVDQPGQARHAATSDPGRWEPHRTTLARVWATLGRARATLDRARAGLERALTVFAGSKSSSRRTFPLAIWLEHGSGPVKRGSSPVKRSTCPFKHGTSTFNRGPSAFEPGPSAFEPGPSASKRDPTTLQRVHGFG